MIRIKKILLIASGQPSLNPRLVKEADALTNAGYQVTVLYTYWNDWGNHLNNQLLPTKKWTAICIGGHPVEKPFTYFISRFIHKSTNWLFNYLHLNFFADFAIARGSFFLAIEAKKHKAHLYIGHNLGALRAVVIAAQKYKAKCGFDAEDFHRQEVSDDPGSINYKMVKYLEDKYYKKLNYLTTSSPQISKSYRQLYPDTGAVTLLNVFPQNVAMKQRITNSADTVKLFWFSQTIGINRGIEDAAKALKLLSANFELHLLGYITKETKKAFIENMLTSDKIFFYEPIPPDELIDFASQFDIGLALEPAFCTNNDLALSNKVLTYLQAGLSIIASDTTAQKSFLDKYPSIGKLYKKKDAISLASVLSAYEADRGLLFDTCEASLKLGRDKLNWENESIKFLSLVSETLKKD